MLTRYQSSVTQSVLAPNCSYERIPMVTAFSWLQTQCTVQMRLHRLSLMADFKFKFKLSKALTYQRGSHGENLDACTPIDVDEMQDFVFRIINSEF